MTITLPGEPEGTDLLAELRQDNFGRWEVWLSNEEGDVVDVLRTYASTDDALNDLNLQYPGAKVRGSEDLDTEDQK
jgi:hypothetical protein